MSKARGVPGPGIVEGDGMTRAVRWLVVVVAAAATFGVCVWVVRAVPWGWLPQGEGPRLDTALAFGAVTAAGVLAAGGWWAARDRTPPAAGSRTRAGGDAGGDGVRERPGHSGRRK